PTICCAQCRRRFRFTSRRRHTRSKRDWSSDVCSSDLLLAVDVPSDLSPDADGAKQRMHADRTVTFGGLKTELVDPRVSAFTGFIDVIDIGLDLDPAQATAELLDAD